MAGWLAEHLWAWGTWLTESFPEGISRARGANHLTPRPSSLQPPGGLLILSCPVFPTLSYPAPPSPIKTTSGLGWNSGSWGSWREGAQKVTWEVMQELEAWELLPEDFLMPLGEHAHSLNTA